VNDRAPATSVREIIARSEFEIEAKTSLVDRPLRNLKHGDCFAVSDVLGDIGAWDTGFEGLYLNDTRFLSGFVLRLERQRLLLLSSTLHEDKSALSVDLTNPDILSGTGRRLHRDTIYIQRTKFLWNGVCYERLKIRNFGDVRAEFELEALFDADFKDLFEVRGTPRHSRGKIIPYDGAIDTAGFRYHGLDGLERTTEIAFSPAPRRITTNIATYCLALDPGEATTVLITVACSVGRMRVAQNFFCAYRDARRARRASTAHIATVSSSNELFNEVLCRAASDIYTLMTDSDTGAYPYAGVPWFNTVFGRDGIVTALLLLWTDPLLARGVLRKLAFFQATTFDPGADAQPGKILHEMRSGEMANCGEVPFGRYYGTVDATPLFLMLASQYFDRTGDSATIDQIWPNIEAALAWIDEFGDRDGDGFVEYQRERASGLFNQGWKDSHDAIFHSDGSDAHGAVALCEVQGYVYAAKRGIARLASQRGLQGMAGRLDADAEMLRNRFDEAFWCEEIGTYAVALDGEKRQCRVRTSNAGHALLTGIAMPQRATRVVESLMGSNLFSGWGIRTLAIGEPRFNPMSYHNGSVWPHDNALIAIGMGRYGFRTEAARLFEGIFSAALHQEVRRLPELFCGFRRLPHRGPTAYPVACAPQAWAAAAPLGILGACLCLQFDQGTRSIIFDNPMLPDFIDEVIIDMLTLDGSRFKVRFNRYENDVGLHVMRREGPPARLLALK